MEWILYIAVYLGIAFITSVITTRSGYKHLLKTDKPIETKDAWGHARPFEDIAKDEAERRKKLAHISRIWGIWLGILWFITWPVEILMTLWAGANKIYNRLTIEPLDQDFQTQRKIHDAQRIVDEYNAEQKKKFDRELEEH
jgi:hypothetical protein